VDVLLGRGVNALLGGQALAVRYELLGFVVAAARPRDSCSRTSLNSASRRSAGTACIAYRGAPLQRP
jgi:hypothetical protein